ncbi:MAG: IS91 family transposase [bacterium]|nr:IS91 family transposase [bacterium]
MPCTAVQHRHRDRPTLELADVFRQCSDPLSHLDGKQARVVRAILSCRTAALGGHIQQCDRCDHNEIAYNSCRDRHCPKCQGSQQFRWLEAQQQHLLPIEYHHVVFTVPDTLRALFRANPRRCYGLLFAAVAETLHDVARNPKNLGATIGFSCVLHTWTQTLLFHPHIHCIVTGGGLDADRRRWIASRRGFLFPVRILAQLFRAKLLRRLESGLNDKTLRNNDVDPHARLRAAARKDWVVYSKPPFAGPRQVLRYLGRYTHRVAISNRRLVTLDHDHVTFRWNDRARGNPKRLMKLDVQEFCRRFLLHILPSGLMRTRHYGLLANPIRRKHLARCRKLLGETHEHSDQLVPPASHHRAEQPRGHDSNRCPRCQTGRLIRVGSWTFRARAP